MSDIRVNKGYFPGAIGQVTELHGTYYHSHWGFGLYFEAMVATGLSTFLKRYDESRDGFWTVSEKERVVATISIDGVHVESKGAHLRWFMVAEHLHGKRIGHQLLHTAIDFCRKKKYSTIYLWTFEGLHVARQLYEKNGFVLAGQRQGREWGTTVTEQWLELKL
ncbi:MAG: GNAT family N-acetyltransferase [Deltaproteobacteria bacterium]|nr:MAG: GNAT family N-acetyltransferase [Deltaproteobacteria bacterium]